MSITTVGGLRLRLAHADWHAITESADALQRIVELDYVRAQLERFDPAAICAALSEFGGGSEDDDLGNRRFLVWVAANLMRDAAGLGPTENYRG